MEVNYQHDPDGDGEYPWIFYLAEGSQMIDGQHGRARTERAAIDGVTHLWRVFHGLAVDEDYPVQQRVDLRKVMK
jgi:hypothetical protein